MKKILYFLHFIFILFIAIDVHAEYTNKFNCTDPSKCMLMCGYDEEILEKSFRQSSGWVENNIHQYVEIYYYTETDEYEIIYKGNVAEQKSYKGTIAELNYNDNVHGGITEGICPYDVAVDLNASLFNLSVEVCLNNTNSNGDICGIFDDDGTDFNEYNDFSSIYQKKIKTTKTYDLTAEVKKYVETTFEDYKKNNYIINTTKGLEENPFCKRMVSDENIAETEYQNLLKKISTSVNNSFFSTLTIPLWIESSNIYEPITTYFTSGEGTKLIENCTIVINNDDTLQISEKNEFMGLIQENVSEFYGKIYHYFENYLNYQFSDDFSGYEDCAGFLGNKAINTTPAYYLVLILNIMKYGAIIFTLVFSVIDFLKAITSQDKEQLKKAMSASVKRLICAIVIFFLPILIDFVLSFLGAYNTCL